MPDLQYQTQKESTITCPLQEYLAVIDQPILTTMIRNVTPTSSYDNYEYEYHLEIQECVNNSKL